jgi:S1-C subfamily serine protease
MRTITPTLALIALVTTLAACGGGSEREQPAVRAASTDAKAGLAAAPAVVAVQGVYGDRTAAGTGVIFDRTKGLVLTANHVMENAPRINVFLSDGTLTHARQVVRAQCHDLAVIQLLQPPANLHALELADSDAVRVGEPVKTLTYLFTSANGKPELTQVAGAVTATGVTVKFPPFRPIGPLIAHQTPLTAPASGSALIDDRGRLIGINTLIDHPHEPALPGVEYALTSSYIARRLRELRDGPEGTLIGWQNEHGKCHGQLHQLLKRGHLHVPRSAGK